MNAQPPRAEIRESLSYVPIQVTTRFGDTDISIGTAFFIRNGERTFLITNWHVVTGRSPVDGQPLHTQAAIPDRIVLRLPVHKALPDGSMLRSAAGRILPLYRDGNRPIWFEHPLHRERVDVVAIPLELTEDTAVALADEARHDLDRLRLYLSLDVFVLGFPRGMSGRVLTPIWKRGTIATEPSLDHDNLPMFLIDTATREGMSGAPVYAQEVGTWLPEGTSDESQRTFGKGRMFVGAYSGRVHAEDEFKAQLGIVWKLEAIEQIIRGEREGRDSFAYLAQN